MFVGVSRPRSLTPTTDSAASKVHSPPSTHPHKQREGMDPQLPYTHTDKEKESMRVAMSIRRRVPVTHEDSDGSRRKEAAAAASSVQIPMDHRRRKRANRSASVHPFIHSPVRPSSKSQSQAQKAREGPPYRPCRVAGWGGPWQWPPWGEGEGKRESITRSIHHWP